MDVSQFTVTQFSTLDPGNCFFGFSARQTVVGIALGRAAFNGQHAGIIFPNASRPKVVSQEMSSEVLHIRNTTLAFDLDPKNIRFGLEDYGVPQGALFIRPESYAIAVWMTGGQPMIFDLKSGEIVDLASLSLVWISHWRIEASEEGGNQAVILDVSSSGP